MHTGSDRGRINVKVVVILALVSVALVGGALLVRHLRREMISSGALAEGAAAYRAGDWTKAVRELREYLAYHPEDQATLERFALASLRIQPYERGNVANAIGAYRMLYSLNPTDRTLQETLVRLYQWVDDASSLTYIARAILADDPNHPKAPLWLAEGLMGLQRPAEAGRTLRDFIARCEDDVTFDRTYVEACRLMADLATQELTADGDRRAADWFDRAVARVGESPWPYAYRAAWLLERVDEQVLETADHERIVADLQAASARPNSDPRLDVLLGDLWMDLGNYAQAAGHIERLASLPADRIPAYFLHRDAWRLLVFQRTARLALGTGRWDSAVALADAVLDEVIDPALRMGALPVAVRLYALAGRSEDAARCHDEYVGIVRYEADAGVGADALRLQRALVAWAANRPYHAIEQLETLMTAGRLDPTGYRLLAQACARTGQHRRAIAVLQDYLLQRPHDASTWRQLADLCLDAGYVEQANTAAAAPVLDGRDPAVRALRVRCRLAAMRPAYGPASEEDVEALRTELDELRRAYPDRVDVKVLQADLLVRTGRRDRAEQVLRRAIASGDPDGVARRRLIERLRQGGRLDEAIVEATLLSADAGDQSDTWIGLAELYLMAGQIDKALQALKDGMAQVDPSRTEELVLRHAIMEVGRGRRAEGIERLQAYAAARPDAVRVRAALLELEEIRADPIRAQTLVDQMRQAEGDSGLLWRLHQARLWLDAVDAVDRQGEVADLLGLCIAADPQWSRPVLLLGAMYERFEQFAQAEGVYRRHLEVDPDSSVVAERLIALLRAQERFEDVVRVQDQLAALAPAAAGAIPPAEARMLAQKVGLLAERGDYDAIIRRMLPKEGSAKHPYTQFVAATALALSSDRSHLAVARQLYEDVCQALPHYVPARHGAAMLAYQSGDHRRAIDQLRLALNDAPDSPDLINDLAWILAETAHEWEEALALTERGLSIDPNHRHLRDTRAMILTHLGRITEAHAEWVRYLGQGGMEPARRGRALLSLARLSLQTGQLEQGRRYLRDARRLDREHHVFSDAERAEIEALLAPVGERLKKTDR
ncbi:MAG: tetratricopeptide repeat protein [Planctomycetota bacterium]